MSVNITAIMETPGTVVCRLPGMPPCWKIFREPVEVVACDSIGMIADALNVLEAESRKGRYAAGFISYEAAAAFDAAYPVRESDFPLLWFGIYDNQPMAYTVPDETVPASFAIDPPQPEIARTDYFRAVDEIKSRLDAGEVYQVNFTFRNRCAPPSAPASLFNALFVRHPMPYAAFVNTGKHQLISLSPELFLEKTGGCIRSCPMKGTASRNLKPVKDRRQAAFLRHDPKNVAENLMIVDMVRNDLGRVCVPGSIRVEPIFEVQTYQTLHQMVSTVHGELMPEVKLINILEATFPAASITGAPKVAAMRQIRRLETSPRRVYTGTVGCFMPNGDFCLNVAIRTLVCDGKVAELGVGGGIVVDSQPADEWNEAMLKSRFIASAVKSAAPLPGSEARTLETMLWRRGRGVLYLREHLRRASTTQRFLGGIWNRQSILAALSKAESRLREHGFARLRLTLDRDCNAGVEIFPLDQKGWGKAWLKLKIADTPTHSGNDWLRHKTTRREFYDRQYKLALDEGYDEVIFLNERNELTEGAISSIFLKIDNKWFTPPLGSGLLPGIWRDKAMKKLMASEKTLYREDMLRADEILLGNAVRLGCRGKVLWQT